MKNTILLAAVYFYYISYHVVRYLTKEYISPIIEDIRAQSKGNWSMLDSPDFYNSETNKMWLKFVRKIAIHKWWEFSLDFFNLLIGYIIPIILCYLVFKINFFLLSFIYVLATLIFGRLLNLIYLKIFSFSRTERHKDLFLSLSLAILLTSIGLILI